MPRLNFNRRRTRKTAHATVYFTSDINPEGNRQLCVFAKCHLSDRRAGPIWAHTDAAVRRCLATLTQICDCPAKYHKAREFAGKRVQGKKKSSGK